MEKRKRKLEKVVENHEVKIKEQKEIIKKLNDSEEKFRFLFENAPDAYFLYDISGIFIDANNAAEELVGYKKEELIAKNMFDLKLLPADQSPGLTDFNLIRKDDGHVFVEIKSLIVKMKDKNVVLSIAHDITKHKKTEKEIERKTEELEKFNRLAIGREFRIIELKNKIKELEGKLNKNGKA